MMKIATPAYYNNFLPLNGDNFIASFKEFKEKTSNYNNLLAALTNQLDAPSSTALENFLNNMLTCPLPTKHCLLHKDKLITNHKAYLEECKFLNNSSAIYHKYNLAGTEKITVSVFKYFNGLKFLPQDITKRLYKTNFIDVGAFFGDSALVLSKFKPSSIISFEPNNINFNNLQATLANRQGCIYKLENLALGDESGEQDLYYASKNQNHGASFMFKAQKHYAHKVKVSTLDTYTKANNVDSIGLIKIDAEGYGLKIIKGAQEVIKQHKPIISCAVYHNPEELFNIKPLLESFNSEYQFMLVELNQLDILKDLTLLAY